MPITLVLTNDEAYALRAAIGEARHRWALDPRSAYDSELIGGLYVSICKEQEIQDGTHHVQVGANTPL